MFLDNTTIITDIKMSKYFYDKNKSVYDITKIAISDDDIDYSLSNTDIKNIRILEPNNNDSIKYTLVDTIPDVEIIIDTPNNPNIISNI